MPQKILVVEDEQALNHSLREFLAGAGYETHGVYDGGAALSAYETFEPDLILLDVMIPVMTGIEVCAKIRETSGVPIIMLTALTDHDDVIK
jgi:two-component system response regulator MtrA